MLSINITHHAELLRPVISALEESTLVFLGGKLLSGVLELDELTAEKYSSVSFCRIQSISDEDSADCEMSSLPNRFGRRVNMSCKPSTIPGSGPSPPGMSLKSSDNVPFESTSINLIKL